MDKKFSPRQLACFRMATPWILIATNALIVHLAAGDIYLHNPRGSNNKLNEVSNNVQNDNRLFDSQNNGKAGYQVGDNCDGVCQDENGNYDFTIDGAGEGMMEYYEGSKLQLEWTNQHGCGSENENVHCNIVLQYMCDDCAGGLRDGVTTTTVPDDASSMNDPIYGRHETYESYQRCKVRERNKGLFTADQNMAGRDTAIYTRQDNAGTRYGFECPEERDYYPYWHPTCWRDIAVCTDETYRCGYYRTESQNVKDKGNCSEPQYNNKGACQDNGGEWKEEGAWNIPKPECYMCPNTRTNHNGDTDGFRSPSFTWTIPEDVHKDGATCVLRIRYNISSGDFDGWSTDKFYNGVNSPVKGNPYKDFLGYGTNISGPLRLNMNTDQYSRTFQDRTHAFRIKKRPSFVDNWIGSNEIINVNVRGRRGNIVQVYPAVEYDFVPTDIKAKKGDYLHIQWTGSDANNRGNDGNGKAGTDRSNLIFVSSRDTNIPMLMQTDNDEDPPLTFTKDIASIIYLSYLNQTGCNIESRDAQDNQNCALMNRAPAYVNAGLVRVDNKGTFYFMSTRNNQFTNRAQKGSIVVEEDWANVAVITSIIVGLASALLLTFSLALGHARRHPESNLAKSKFVSAIIGSQQSETSSPKKRGSFLSKYPQLQKWWEWERQKFLVLSAYAFANCAIWSYGLVYHWGEKKAPYFPFAKGFGKVLNFNCSFILLPVMRNVLSWLRTTPAAEVVPLDKNIKFHKLIGAVIAFSAIGHITFHYMDYVWYHQHYFYTVEAQALANLPGLTGHIILLLMAIMMATSMSRVRRGTFTIFGRRIGGFSTFYHCHKLWMPAIGLLWLHGPNFWAYSIWPLLFMKIERLIQAKRRKIDVQVVDVKILEQDVLVLRMGMTDKKHMQKKFHYKAGQYLFLNCPDISNTEYHPFTITSAPEEEYFSCHIRCRREMDWTHALKERFANALANPCTDTWAAAKDPESGEVYYYNSITKETAWTPPASTPTREQTHLLFPRLRVDGPYGSAAEEVFDYGAVVLVGAGIGVTPFASIIKCIKLRSQQDFASTQLKKMRVYFYWICRDMAEFDSFKELMREVVEDSGLKERLEVNTYTTGEMDLKTVKHELWNQFSGRPNWNRILKEKAAVHTGEEVGVFICGPAAMAQDLKNACRKNTTDIAFTGPRTIFKFHKENF